MTEPTDADKQEEIAVYQYLFSLANLTEQEVHDLLVATHTPFPVEPDPIALDAVQTIFGVVQPGSAMWANDRLLARRQRLAAAFTQIRIALREKARQTEHNN